MSNTDTAAADLKRRPMPPAANLLEPDHLNLTPHPSAALMPMMDEESFKMFKANISKEGIKEPMIIYQGLLLDGRNRYRAARELGLKLTAANFKTFDGTPAQQQTETGVRAEDDRKVSGRVRQGARADDFSLEEHNRRGTRRSCTLAR
jgi:hypothetical protein